VSVIKWGNPDQQDSAWYVNGEPYETVWEQSELTGYCVSRVGEMRIHYTSPTGNTVLRYTEDIVEVAKVKTDKELIKMTTDEFFDWDSNSWFEVLSDADGEFESPVFDVLDDAIAFAIELASNGTTLEKIEEPNIIY